MEILDDDYQGECDCGEPAARDGMCSRCAFLDGFERRGKFGRPSASEGGIIAHLRITLEAGAGELANATGTSLRNTYRSLRQLEASGRIVRRLDEADHGGAGFGGTGRVLYRLWEPS